MKKIFLKLLSLAVLGIMASSFLSAVAFAVADTERPGDVENVVVTPFSEAVRVSWDAATDNVGVTGYQVHYGLTTVDESGEEYDDFIDVGDTLEYVVTGLTNDETYYFSVIAYDAATNESENWAIEQSGVPSEEFGSFEDSEAPQVASVEALNKVEVEIVFTEAVVLPAEDPKDAFSIENQDNFEELIVMDAEMDEDDRTNKTVILTTAEQEEGALYKLTNVSSDVEDLAGNPIVSGISDQGEFTGSGEEKSLDDEDGPEVVSVEAVDNTTIMVNFDEAIVLSINPEEDFTIMEEDDATRTLEVLVVELGSNEDGVEDAAAIITTSPQEDKSYMLVASNLTDETGNVVNPARGGAAFQGIFREVDVPDEVDTTAPANIGELFAETMLDVDKYIVKLYWEIPAENEGDVEEQIVYQSEDGEDYNKKATLDPDVTEYSVENLEAGEYWFKVTQKDEAGNESEGVIKKVVLSETGPEMIGLVLVSLGLGSLFRRKRG